MRRHVECLIVVACVFKVNEAHSLYKKCVYRLNNVYYVNQTCAGLNTR